MRGKFRINEIAVSPVIGVMLMIVVTVVIAAVVSAFAGGLSDTSRSTPVAAFEFKVYSDWQYSSMKSAGSIGQYLVATMKSGEPIDTSDLKIVSYHKDKNGALVSKEFEKSRETVGAYNSLDVFRVMHEGSAKVFGVKGTYWHTGEVFSGGPGYVLDMDDPQPGDEIEISVVYKPTNTVIWSDEVTVI